jgi:hypothetical protein
VPWKPHVQIPISLLSEACFYLKYPFNYILLHHSM